MEDHHNSIHNPVGSPTGDQQQTILLVDDDNESLQDMSEILRMSGYSVAVFHEAPSALYFANREVRKFDLVITDYRMPGMNGLELVEALRRLLPDVPVIMLTAHGDIDTYFKAFKLGIFEYINKPVNASEFRRIVKVALERGIHERAPAIPEALTENPDR